MSRQNQRDAYTRQLHESTAIRLHARGKTSKQIGEILGIPDSTVRADIIKVKKRWLKEDHDFITKELMKTIVNLNEINKEAWEAYEQSFEDVKTQKTRRRMGIPKHLKNKKDKKGKSSKTAQDPTELQVIETETTKELKQMRGDPRFLKVATEAENAKIKALKDLELKGGKSKVLENIARAMGVLPEETDDDEHVD